VIAYPPSLKAVGGARTGVAPAHLLDVQDVNGNLYYWSDRSHVVAPVRITGVPPGVTPPIAVPANSSVAWALPRSCALSGVAPPALNGYFAQTPQGYVENAFLQLRGTGTLAIAFTNFAPPALPVNAVVNSIVPVMLAVGTDKAQAGAPVTGNCGLTASGNFSGEYFAASLCSSGTSQSAAATLLAAASITAQIADTTPDDVNYQDLTIAFAGFAVYYSIASGLSDALPAYARHVPSIYQPWNLSIGAASPYLPWLVSVPQFTFHRSLITDMGSFTIQNLSGDTLSRDFEKIARRSALEGALFVYRLWQADAQAAWLEVHGTLTVDDVGVDTVQLKGMQLLNPSQEDTPLENYSETCQLQWGGRRCGATGSTECSYSFATCQVVERIMVAMNNYEKNYGETAANTAQNVINRRRVI
jgi:hypothetical protein